MEWDEIKWNAWSMMTIMIMIMSSEIEVLCFAMNNFLDGC